MKRELQNREIYQAYDHMNRHDYFQSSYSIPEHLGTGFIHCYAIPWGIVIGEFFMQYRQDMVFRGRSTSGTFEFTFCLGDEIDWTLTSMDDSQVIRMKQNQAFFSHDRNGVEEICYKNGKTYHFIGIRIPGKTLTQLLEPTYDNRTTKRKYPIFALWDMNDTLKKALFQLMQPSIRGKAKNLYQQGLILELCSYCMDAVCPVEDFTCEPIALGLDTGFVLPDSGDLHTVNIAVQFLKDHIECAPSCKELAGKLYVSESKLQRLFKRVFGMTIHQYLQELRVQKARRMFMDGECRISRVASAVGYENLSHFSAVFQRKYGTTPKQFCRSLRQNPQKMI